MANTAEPVLIISEINCIEKTTKPRAMDKRTGHISGFHPDSPEVSPTLKAVQAYSINPKDTQIMRGAMKNSKMLK